MVARVDSKLHRDRGVLEVKGVWWEEGAETARKRRGELEHAIDEFAHAIGGERVEFVERGRVASR